MELNDEDSLLKQPSGLAPLSDNENKANMPVAAKPLTVPSPTDHVLTRTATAGDAERAWACPGVTLVWRQGARAKKGLSGLRQSE
jgi:hypothetical protein